MTDGLEVDALEDAPSRRATQRKSQDTQFDPPSGSRVSLNALLRVAKEFSEEEDYESAVVSYETALSLKDENDSHVLNGVARTDTLWELACECEDAGQTDKALGYLEQALGQIDHNKFHGLKGMFRMGGIAHLENQLDDLDKADEVISCYEKALDLSDNDGSFIVNGEDRVILQCNLADLLYCTDDIIGATEKSTKAVKILTEVFEYVKKNQTSHYIIEKLQYALFLMKKLSKEEEDGNIAISLCKQILDAKNEMGQCVYGGQSRIDIIRYLCGYLLEDEQREEFIVYAKKTLAVTDANGKAILKGEPLALTLGDIASALEETGKRVEAISYYKKAIEVKAENGDSPLPADVLAKHLDRLGKLLFDSGKISESIPYLKKAYSLSDPEDEDRKQIHSKLTQALLKEISILNSGKQTSKAYECLCDLMTYGSSPTGLNLDVVKSLVDLGVALKREGKLENAIKAHEYTLKIVSNALKGTSGRQAAIYKKEKQGVQRGLDIWKKEKEKKLANEKQKEASATKKKKTEQKSKGKGVKNKPVGTPNNSGDTRNASKRIAETQATSKPSPQLTELSSSPKVKEDGKDKTTNLGQVIQQTRKLVRAVKKDGVLETAQERLTRWQGQVIRRRLESRRARQALIEAASRNRKTPPIHKKLERTISSGHLIGKTFTVSGSNDKVESELNSLRDPNNIDPIAIRFREVAAQLEADPTKGDGKPHRLKNVHASAVDLEGRTSPLRMIYIIEGDRVIIQGFSDHYGNLKSTVKGALKKGGGR